MKDLIVYLKRNKPTYMGNNVCESAYYEGFSKAVELIQKYENETKQEWIG